jgi:Secretion system C-terminal sorting domain
MKKLLSLIIISLISLIGFAQNKNISGGAVFEGEPYLAVNPTNPQNMVVAWIGYVFGAQVGIKVKATFNGGATWSSAHVLPHFASSYHSADPSLAFDRSGNLFACYIDYRESPDSGGVYIAKSTDGGLSWSIVSQAINVFADAGKSPIDRPWLSINPLNDHFYVTSKPPSWVPAPNRSYFVSSADEGLTWNHWKYTDTTGFLIGNAIQAPMAVTTATVDGKLHMMYPSYVPAQNPLPGFLHASSTDDGVTFHYNGAYYGTGGVPDTLAKLGYRLFSDPSNANHLGFINAHQESSDYDVYLIESLDGGLTWSAKQRVNDDAYGNGKMQELVWADFDAHGNIVAGWRDRRNASGTGYATGQEIWGAIKWKDSSNFTPNFRISDTMAPYNATYLSQSGNDFMCIAMVNDTVDAVWGDVRSGKLNIYFSRTDAHSLHTSIKSIDAANIQTVEVFPNPAADRIQFGHEAWDAVYVYNTSGSMMIEQHHLNPNTGIDVKSLSKGEYFAKLVAAEGEAVVKFEKQ